MPPKSKQETVVIVINVGVTTAGEENDGKFVERAKPVVTRLIEKKIFLRPNDLIAILVAGAESKKCVEELYGLELGCWEMVEKVLTLKSTDVYCNWVDALKKSIDYMKDNMPAQSTYSKVTPMRKIIMLSDFKADWTKTNNVCTNLAGELNDNFIQLLAIGKGELDEECKLPQTSQEFLSQLLESISGRYVTLDFAASDLMYYKVPPKKPFPWYSTLELTPQIKIPIVAYVKVKEETKFPSWKRARKDEKVVTVKQHLDKWKNEYKQDEMTKGYKYGSEFHAVSSVHEKNMSFESGPRCYRIFGFTKTAFVGLDRWCRASTRVILPSTDVAAREFFCLVQAMANNGLAAIVRKIHNNNMVPRMVALFPCISSEEPWCLVEVTLPYREDNRILSTHPMKGILKQATSEQNDAVDQLLDALQLNDSEEKSEDVPSFLPGTVPNPTIQHKWNMLSYRAMHPDKPLPAMDDHLKQALKIPSVHKRCQEPLESIKPLFRMEKIIPQKKWQHKEGQQQEVTTSPTGDVKEETPKKEEPMEAVVDKIPDGLAVDMSDVDMDDWDTI